jgi:hypothetical protein
MAFDEQTRQAAMSLGQKLSPSPWYSSVGIAEQDSHPVLIVYLRRRSQQKDPGIPQVWEGIPVQVKQIGRILPARQAS